MVEVIEEKVVNNDVSEWKELIKQHKPDTEARLKTIRKQEADETTRLEELKGKLIELANDEDLMNFLKVRKGYIDIVLLGADGDDESGILTLFSDGSIKLSESGRSDVTFHYQPEGPKSRGEGFYSKSKNGKDDQILGNVLIEKKFEGLTSKIIDQAVKEGIERLIAPPQQE